MWNERREREREAGGGKGNMGSSEGLEGGGGVEQ